MRARILMAVVLLIGLAAPALAQTGAPPDAIELFVLSLEQAAGTGVRAKVQALAHPEVGGDAVDEFASSITPPPTRIVLKERDRSTVDGDTRRLLLEVFVERGREARLSTWRMDIRLLGATSHPSDGAASDWRIVRMDRLTVVSGLHQLALDPNQQFTVRDLTLVAPDLTIRLASGSAFVATTPEGPTAVVLLGRGRMVLAPADKAEQTQIGIFTDSDSGSLDGEFDAAFIRIRPSEFAARFRAESFVPGRVVPADLRRATDVFDEYVGRTLQVDMSDLSRERWSLVPSAGDFIAEIRTRRHGSLTYARTWNDAEDVAFFDRRKRRNIAVYASTEKLAARGRFYSEDDLVDYDILSYDVDAAFFPDKQWISGNTRITLKVRALQLSTMSLRLAESLVVRGVYSPDLGRLLHLRIVGQHSLIVNLPVLAPRDSEITLNILYGGRVEPQELEREAISVAQEPDLIPITLEPRYIYSNRSYWYPQGSVTDFATARIRITVPPEFDVVASGMPTAPPAPAPGPVPEGERPRKVFVFESERPVRYIACVISRFATVSTAEVVFDAPAIAVDDDQGTAGRTGDDETVNASEARRAGSVSLIVRANPRQAGRARALSAKATEVMKFYASLIGEAPYPSFTLAVTESDLPGGHSPPYFAILNQSLPSTNVTWRNDPVAFENYPTFFLAHELAHQWWGQAVGWKNYHEQWISEGFAQYFAILFAEQEREGITPSLLRQMRKTAMHSSDQGPVYLGYRLGHIRADSRVFRALVYNKAAMVLHMLRRFVGDEAFFRGVRQFYEEWRFRKAGTDDFRVAMERASRRDLAAFFEGWIYGASVPRVRFHHQQAEKGVLVRFEHRDEVVHVPITVTITYASGEVQQVVVPVTERVVERTIPVHGPVRKVEANADNGSLAEIER